MSARGKAMIGHLARGGKWGMWWAWLLAISGCYGVTGEDAHSSVEALAREWPSYRAPAMADPATVLRQEFGLPAAAWGPERLAREESNPPAVRPPVQPAEAWPLSETAMDSLGRIGAPAVPALVQTLHHPDPQRRSRAARVLARIGPAARSAVPALVASLHDPDLSVQKAAARALGQIGPSAQQAVEPLIELLARPEPVRPSRVVPATYGEPVAEGQVERGGVIDGPASAVGNE